MNASLHVWNQLSGASLSTAPASSPSVSRPPRLVLHPCTSRSTLGKDSSLHEVLVSTLGYKCTSEAWEHNTGLGHRVLPRVGRWRGLGTCPWAPEQRAEPGPSGAASLTACRAAASRSCAAGSLLLQGKTALVGGQAKRWPDLVTAADGGFAPT